jgi:hypothetical protein
MRTNSSGVIFLRRTGIPGTEGALVVIVVAVGLDIVVEEERALWMVEAEVVSAKAGMFRGAGDIMLCLILKVK